MSLPSIDPVDAKNVQGDVVLGLVKRVEAFVFLKIDDPADFVRHMKTIDFTSCADVQADINNAAEARKNSTMRVWLPIVQTNIAFSATGLKKLNVSLPPEGPFSETSAFGKGQEADGVNLGDDHKEWRDFFLGKQVDVVLIATAHCRHALDEHVSKLLHIFCKSVTKLGILHGVVRPGNQEGHEHFGFKDGISAPVLRGFNETGAAKGQDIVEPSLILTGHGSNIATTPEWAKDGAFMVFRDLRQMVPEFHKNFKDIAISLQPKIPGISGEFLEARCVGRWPSGLSLAQSPLVDDPTKLSPETIQDFDYSNDRLDPTVDTMAVSGASHVRKSNPRAGTIIPRDTGIKTRLMIRNGIPYGPEVSHDELAAGESSADPSQERGLLFASYQASIENQFQFVQQSWLNNPTFPPVPSLGRDFKSGEDLIVGVQAPGSEDRSAQGIIPKNATDPNNLLKVNQLFVKVRGGEYFFSPSIATLKSGFVGDGGSTATTNIPIQGKNPAQITFS